MENPRFLISPYHEKVMGKQIMLYHTTPHNSHYARNGQKSSNFPGELDRVKTFWCLDYWKYLKCIKSHFGNKTGNVSVLSQQCPGGQFSWSVGSQEPPHLSPDTGEEHHHHHLKYPQLIHSRRLKLCEIKASRGSFKPWKGFRQKTSNMMRGKSLCGS